MSLRNRLLHALALACALAGAEVSSAVATWRSVERPIDPAQLSSVPFGYRSFWQQPWRAYLDTPPATALRDGMGIHLNIGNEDEARVVAPLLRDSGIKTARLELSWTGIDLDDRSRFTSEARVRSMLGSLRDFGVRPLILLNANSGAPGPTRFFTARLTEPAAAGARAVRLDPESAAAVVPGRSGLNYLRHAAGVLFTSVSPSGVAALSRPLPAALGAGEHEAATLAYEPFARPRLADGSPNPRFERTLAGWLDYVGVTTRLVREVLGSQNFDVEIWNELSNGSLFLDEGQYYGRTTDVAIRKEIIDTILRRTVAYLRDPANGVERIGIGNGFSNQTPFPSGSTSPVGLTANDKHTYAPRYSYPSDLRFDGIRGVDALGEVDAESLPQPDGSTRWRDRFIPPHSVNFPEYWLSGLQTETLVRDLAPTTEFFAGADHGRDTAPPGGTPPEVWITETNVDPVEGTGLTVADYDRVHAKAALRSYVSYINKGVTMVQMYGVKDAPRLNLVSPGFFTAAEANGWQYPGAAAGGPTMAAIGRLAAMVGDAEAIATPRALRLEEISDNHDNTQFLGDGTAGRPPLYDRDVLAFMPFQLSAHRFVAGVYVTTRDLTAVRRDLPAGDPRRTDLAPATYRLKVGNLDAAHARVQATDPLTGEQAPASIVARSGDTITVEMQATDSPRMLTIDDAATAAPDSPAGVEPELLPLEQLRRVFTGDERRRGRRRATPGSGDERRRGRRGATPGSGDRRPRGRAQATAGERSPAPLFDRGTNSRGSSDDPAPARADPRGGSERRTRPEAPPPDRAGTSDGARAPQAGLAPPAAVGAAGNPSAGATSPLPGVVLAVLIAGTLLGLVLRRRRGRGSAAS